MNNKIKTREGAYVYLKQEDLHNAFGTHCHKNMVATSFDSFKEDVSNLTEDQSISSHKP